MLVKCIFSINPPVVFHFVFFFLFFLTLLDISPGISMTLLQTKDGVHYFTFEHNRDYQQIQFKFLDAVESMDPNNIVVKKLVLCYSSVT